MSDCVLKKVRSRSLGARLFTEQHQRHRLIAIVPASKNVSKRRNRAAGEGGEARERGEASGRNEVPQGHRLLQRSSIHSNTAPAVPMMMLGSHAARNGLIAPLRPKAAAAEIMR